MPRLLRHFWYLRVGGRAPFVELPELHPLAATLGAGASYPARYFVAP